MKKHKPARETRPAATATAAAPKPADRRWPGWTWAAAGGGLLLALAVYAPALSGGFVFDDRFLPFFAPHASDALWDWIRGLRPLLMLSFWIDYRAGGGADPPMFHATNVILHFFTSTLVALIAARLLEWAGATGRARTVLAVFAGALFLLHPVQTESVAYVASRSENLSVLFYFAAFAVFLYKRGDSITPARAIAVTVLFGAAAATKEHTLTLPILLLLTDLYWNRGGIRRNAIVYGLLAAATVGGGLFVAKVLREATSAGFNVKDLTPAAYFFTQGRVIWIYVRMFILPFGQNIDPDVAVSRSLFDHGAIIGLAALAAVTAAAWIWRKRFPLAAYGWLVFLLLLAPTSTFIPIRDVLAEHRLYLPFVGLALIALEFLRRWNITRAAWTCAAILTASALLTYQRNQVWANSLVLWEDAASKSPQKYRPRFQLAFAQYESNQCSAAAESYEKASTLAPVDDQLLIDWALALDCAGREDDALAKLRQALVFGATAHVYSQIGMIYAKQAKFQDALIALAQAEKLDPRYEMTYVYRGHIYALAGDRNAAVREYQRALALNPDNQAARNALQNVSR